VYDGLYMKDASIVPGPLAVNPMPTMAAMAAKIADAIPGTGLTP
jgi:choline dehydrogenase-like flavoprotein